ncbi:sulfurtransferase [bacterium]|nr:sulfurtransferase [bacterium]
MKNHSPGFLAVVEDAKSRVREVNVEQTFAALKADPKAVLVDVREESEFAAGRVTGAVHMSKGVIERDVEKHYPDPETPLYLYCGGGFRSALAADNLQKMGYKKVYSVAGGWRALVDSGAPIEK